MEGELSQVGQNQDELRLNTMRKEELNPSPEYTTRNTCRVCPDVRLEPVLSLGEITLPGWKKDPVDGVKVPLELCRCPDCTLVQLKHTTRPDLLYNSEYGYKSGVNQTMRDHLTGIVGEIEGIVPLGEGDIVVDIGCNDGTLLDAYNYLTFNRVGFDPSRNVLIEAAGLLKDYGAENFQLFNGFFRKEPFERRFGTQKAKVVTAISMFYDLEDPNKFVADVKAILDENGVFVIQQNYVLGMLEQGAFDNICHEHLEYYSLTSLENLLRRHGLEVFNVSQHDLNGGSFKTLVRHIGSRVGGEPNGNLNRLRQIEERVLTDGRVYQDFAMRTRDRVRALREFVETEVAKGKTFHVYGASTRGNTLLQATGLDHTLIAGAAERNPGKYGTYTAGTKIPVVSEDQARNAKPDYFLVLPWFFKDEFVAREQEFIKGGGRLVFPLPRLEVIGNG